MVSDRVTGSRHLSYHPEAFEFSDIADESRKTGKVRGALFPVEYELERLVSNIVNPLPSWNRLRTCTPVGRGRLFWRRENLGVCGEMQKIDGFISMECTA